MRERVKSFLFSRPDWFSYLFFIVITLALTLPVILQHQAPHYVDQMGHLFRVWFLTDAVREGDLLPQWLPYWYSGMDTFRYYPPLSTYLMLPFNLIIDDPIDTYYIFGAVIMFVTCITSYRFAREFISRPFAVIAALLYTFSSLTIASYWFEGNFGRTLVAAIAPLVFLFAYRTLCAPVRGSFVLLAISTALLILAHAMQAYMTLLVLAPWLLVIAIFPQRRWNGLVITGTGIALGIGLSLFWLLPANTHIDLANVPALYIDKLFIYSIGFDSFNPFLFHNNVFGSSNYLSVALLIAAVLGAVFCYRSKFRWHGLGYFIAIILGIILSFGTKSGDWYLKIPVLNSSMPLRFTLSILLPASILAGMGLYLLVNNIASVKSYLMKFGKLALAVFLIAIFLWDYLPGIDLVTPGRESPQEDIALSLSEEQTEGRVIVFARANSEGSYWPTAVGEKRQAFGWAIEGTIHNGTMPEMNKAIAHENNSYLNHLFNLWQVNYAILGSDLIDIHRDNFIKMGFQQVAETGQEYQMPVVLMARTDPLPPAFSFNQNVLAVGVGATGLSRHLPWIATGTSESLEDHDIEFLRSFDAIVLWEPIIKEQKRFEELVSELATVGTDIYISPGRLVGDFAFDVASRKVAMSGVCRVENDAGALTPVDGGTVIILPEDWYGHIYDGMDGTEMFLENDEGTMPLLQYKIIEGRKVYFIGAAALCLLDTASVNEAKSLLVENILARSHPDTNPGLTPLVSEVTLGKDSMTVDITTEEDSWVILSESYSPSWKISRDGIPVKYQNFENMLSFQLPAGEHTLDFRYGLTAIQKVSIALSLIFLCLLVLTAIYFNRLISFYQRIIIWLRHMASGASH